MHKIDPAVLKEICVQKRILRVCQRELQQPLDVKNCGNFKIFNPPNPKIFDDAIVARAEAVAELQRLTNCEQYIIDEVLPVKVKHGYTQAAEVHMTTNGQLGFNFRATGHIGEVYKTQDGTEYFVLAIV